MIERHEEDQAREIAELLRTREFERKLAMARTALQAMQEERDRAIAERDEAREQRDKALAERDLAQTDELTGLPNRRKFMQQYNEFEKMVAYGEGEVFIVLLHFDVHDLHGINATYGNPGGDKVIKLAAGMPHAIAGALNKYLRREDAAARMGGDEFMAALLVDYPAIRGSIPEFLEDLLQRFDHLTQLQNLQRRRADGDPVQPVPALRLHRDVTAVTLDDLRQGKTFDVAYEEIGLKGKESGRQE